MIFCRFSGDDTLEIRRKLSPRGATRHFTLAVKFDQNSTKIRPKFDQKSINIRPKVDQNSTKIRPKSEISGRPETTTFITEPVCTIDVFFVPGGQCPLQKSRNQTHPASPPLPELSLLLSISVDFCRFSVDFCRCSVNFCRFLTIFCRFLSISVDFCRFLTIFCRFSVEFCRFLDCRRVSKIDKVVEEFTKHNHSDFIH